MGVAQLFEMEDGKFCIWELDCCLRWRLNNCLRWDLESFILSWRLNSVSDEVWTFA